MPKNFGDRIQVSDDAKTFASLDDAKRFANEIGLR